MKTKSKIAAGALSLMLLAGGLSVGNNTFAAWNQSATLASTTVNSGRLDIVGTPSLSWKDFSVAAGTKTYPATKALFDSGGASVNIASDLMVPGDTFVALTPLDLHTSGRNLRATVTTNPGATGALMTAGATVETIILSANGTEVAKTLGAGSSTLNIISPELLAKLGTLPASTFATNASGTADFFIMVVVHFPWATSGSTGENAALTIPGTNFITVTQTRS